MCERILGSDTVESSNLRFGIRQASECHSSRRLVDSAIDSTDPWTDSEILGLLDEISGAHCSDTLGS